MQAKILGIMDGLGVKNESLQKTFSAYYGDDTYKNEIKKVHQEVIKNWFLGQNLQKITSEKMIDLAKF